MTMFFFLKILSRLPIRLLYILSTCLSFLLKKFYRRKLVIRNLRVAFPNKSKEELALIVNDFYQNFADVVIEILKGVSMAEHKIASRINFINPEITFAFKKKNQPLLFYASHQCNWEWMALASATKLSIAGDVIYKPLENPHAEKLIYEMRSRFGGTPIPEEKAAREILKRKKRHCIIGLVADQSPPRESVHWTHFLGRETDFYPGLIQLPYMMQASAFFGRIIKTKRGYYDIEFVPIGEPPYEKDDFTVLKNYIQETERLIREYPENYLWSHNRWKHTREESEEMIIFS